MSILLLSIQIYLAAILGVSGFAKIVDLETFAATLRNQRVLPIWGGKAVSRVVPWFEIALAILLVLGVFDVLINMLMFATFTCFLMIEIILVKTKRSRECGCYGIAYRRQVDNASLVVSSVFVVLAGFSLWGAFLVEPVNLVWRMSMSLIFGLCGLWLVSKTLYKKLETVS